MELVAITTKENSLRKLICKVLRGQNEKSSFDDSKVQA